MSLKAFKGHHSINNMIKMTNVKIQRKGVLSTKEIGQTLKKADSYKMDFFKLRAKALVSIFITGKRRAAVSTLEMDDLEIHGNYLYVTFTVVKKRKKNVLSKRRTKRFHLESPYAQHIIEYWEYLKKFHPKCKYLFPSVHCIFGRSFIVYFNKHLSGRQILRIIQDLNPKSWCHLFRETRGAGIVKKDEDEKGEAGILTVYRVQRALDLERETTAWEYIKRYAVETIEAEDPDIL